MAPAIEGAGDLVLIAGLIVAIGLLYTTKWIVQGIRKLLDFGINLGFTTVHPLRWAIDGLAGWIEGGCESAIKWSQGKLTALFYGLVDSLGLIIGAPLALGLGIKDALVYLWHTAIRAFVNGIVNPVRTLATKAERDAQTAISTAAKDLQIAKRYAETEAASALRDAKSFATREAHAAEAAATDYADTAVAKLRAAESQAIASARAIAVGAEEALRTIEGAMTPEELAALLAAIPALAVLVHAIATEAGLDNPECRGKVKGICGTNPARWGKLLGELALLTGLLNFRELVALCRPLVKPAADLIRQAA